MSKDKVRVSGSISQAHKQKLIKGLKAEKVNQGEYFEKLIDRHEEYEKLLAENKKLKAENEKLKQKLNKVEFGELSYSLLGLKVHHNQDGSLKEDEIKIVDDAVKNSGLPLEEIVRSGTLQRAKYFNSIAQSQAKLDSMSESELKEQTFKGVANFRINQAIETIINYNDNQPEKSNKICLTRGIVFKITGSNRQTINKFFDTYQQMIEDHNHKHQLTDRDNRKGKNYDVKQVLGI